MQTKPRQVLVGEVPVLPPAAVWAVGLIVAGLTLAAWAAGMAGGLGGALAILAALAAGCGASLRPSPIDASLDEPPVSTHTIWVIGLIGLGLTLVAFVTGVVFGAPRQGFGVHPSDGPRALLAIVGFLVAGCAVSMRPGWYGGWLCAAACGVIGYGFGGSPPAGTEWYLAPPRDWHSALPNSWDSVQLYFGVGGVACLIGAIWTRLPRKAIFCLVLLGVGYHFSSILSAITSPPPTPLVSDHYWARVARPYVQFAYMNNAYQFYSPDPGPACQLWACIEYKTEDPDGPKDFNWITVVDRKNEYIDPLGLTYYRRLSITENTTQSMPAGYSPLAEEHEKILARRALAARDRIPRTFLNENLEYLLPNHLISRQILPSYARHIAHHLAQPGKAVKSVKIYRVIHSSIKLNLFRGFDPSTGEKVEGFSPYDPSLYLPFFQGEFDANGRLVDPTAEMLYWYVPILKERPLPPGGWNSPEYHRNGGFKKYYRDYVSEHAGCPRPQE
ncbi:MAG: hypothetical protein EXS09_09605 [Gemmataceae bacterium]|nr:hypothetical protein [Gemmataceae bacterium]